MKTRGIVIIAAVIVASGAGALVYASSAEKVAAVSAARGTMQESIEIRGKVDLSHKSKVFSQLPALVKVIDVSEGDAVGRNAQLAELQADDFANASEITGLAVSNAENTVRNLSGNIIPERSRAYELAKEQYLKNKASYESGSLSLAELQACEAGMNAAQMALADARSQLEAAQMSAEQMKLQKKDAETDLGRVRVLSGMAGTILNKYVDEGSGVQAGIPLFEVGDMGSAFVRVDVPAEDAVRIRLGQKAEISGEVTGGTKVEGKVYYIAPKAETAFTSLGVEQQRVEIRISFDNSSLGLKPGFGVDTKIITVEKQALYVPNDSVFDSQGSNSVFVVADGRLQLRDIKTGIENNSYIEVLEGLSEKDKVVSDLRNSLKPGMRVKAAE